MRKVLIEDPKLIKILDEKKKVLDDIYKVNEQIVKADEERTKLGHLNNRFKEKILDWVKKNKKTLVLTEFETVAQFKNEKDGYYAEIEDLVENFKQELRSKKG